MSKKIELPNDEYEHVITTLEGCSEELAELEATVDWYSTLLIERIEECLAILRDRVQP